MKPLEDIKRETIEFIMVDMLALPMMGQNEDDASWFHRLDDKQKSAVYLLLEFEQFSQNPDAYLEKSASIDGKTLAHDVKELSHINAAHYGEDAFAMAMARYAAFRAMESFFAKAKERLHLLDVDSPFSVHKHGIQIDILGLELNSNRASYCALREYDGEPVLPDFKQEFVARSMQRQSLPKFRI